MNISVVIPVYNNKLRLEKCLTSLIQQTISREKYEIIVVDNGSTDGSFELAKIYANCVLLQSRIKSPYPSRNLGIRYAKGYYKILVDSNIIVPNNFLSTGIHQLEMNNSDFGAPLIKFEINENSISWELLDSLIYADIKNGIKNNTVPGGCVFTKNNFFDRFGYFDEDLRSNGDTVWSRNATIQGAKLSLLDQLEVLYPPKDMNELLKKARRIGKGNRNVWIKNGKSVIWITAKSLWSLRPLSYNKFRTIVNERRENNIKYPVFKLWLYNWIRIIYTGFGRLGL